MENDLLEAIIALPLDLFYNTGQPTYILLLTNTKEQSRKGKVQLIKGDSFFNKMVKGLGNKKNELLTGHIDQIIKLYLNQEQNEFSKIYSNSEFGYYSVKVQHSQNDFSEGYDIKDFEYIPLNVDIEEYFKKEVYKYTPNAKPDLKNIKVGYSINFIEKFHLAAEHRELEEVIKDVDAIEKKSVGLLNELLK